MKENKCKKCGRPIPKDKTICDHCKTQNNINLAKNVKKGILAVATLVGGKKAYDALKDKFGS